MKILNSELSPLIEVFPDLLEKTILPIINGLLAKSCKLEDFLTYENIQQAKDGFILPELSALNPNLTPNSSALCEIVDAYESNEDVKLKNVIGFKMVDGYVSLAASDDKITIGFTYFDSDKKAFLTKSKTTNKIKDLSSMINQIDDVGSSLQDIVIKESMSISVSNLVTSLDENSSDESSEPNNDFAQKVSDSSDLTSKDGDTVDKSNDGSSSVDEESNKELDSSADSKVTSQPEQVPDANPTQEPDNEEFTNQVFENGNSNAQEESNSNNIPDGNQSDGDGFGEFDDFEDFEDFEPNPTPTGTVDNSPNETVDKDEEFPFE